MSTAEAREAMDTLYVLASRVSTYPFETKGNEVAVLTAALDRLDALTQPQPRVTTEGAREALVWLRQMAVQDATEQDENCSCKLCRQVRTVAASLDRLDALTPPHPRVATEAAREALTWFSEFARSHPVKDMAAYRAVQLALDRLDALTKPHPRSTLGTPTAQLESTSLANLKAFALDYTTGSQAANYWAQILYDALNELNQLRALRGCDACGVTHNPGECP